MAIVNRNSLAATLDAVNEAHFYSRPLAGDEKLEAARWIAGRQGLPGTYAGLPAPTDLDCKEGARAFTGDKIRSGGGLGHILGEEACRALIVLDVPDAEVQAALARATEGMMSRLYHETGEPNMGCWGTYCCGICSVAYWRHLAVGGLRDSEARLAAGVETLRACRDPKGRWGHFPFYYALLALSEIGLPAAVEELRYAAPVCERSLKRSAKDDRYARRRRDLVERVLARA